MSLYSDDDDWISIDVGDGCNADNDVPIEDYGPKNASIPSARPPVRCIIPRISKHAPTRRFAPVIEFTG